MTRNEQGRFEKGNTAAAKLKHCPHCNKELKVGVYIQITKQIDSDRLKTEEVSKDEGKKKSLWSLWKI